MATATPTVEAIPYTSQRKRMVRTFLRNRTAIFGLGLVILIMLSAIFADAIAWHDPYAQSARNRLTPPGDTYLLGRDQFGRDVFARLLVAGRVSLVVGVSSVALGMALGTLLGILAGYFGGRLETVLMRLVDILMAFPSLILGLVVLAVLGAGLRNIILAIGIVLAPGFARVVHATTLSLKRLEFVEAARAVGASPLRIMARHVLPNTAGEIIVLASLWTASAIRIEASLSFIGLGVDPRIPTWGNMIREGTANLFDAPWLSLWPGFAIFLTVLAFNLLGDGLRDILDPKLQT